MAIFYGRKITVCEAAERFIPGYGRSPAMASVDDLAKLERLRTEDPEAYSRELRGGVRMIALGLCD